MVGNSASPLCSNNNMITKMLIIIVIRILIISILIRSKEREYSYTGFGDFFSGNGPEI